MKMIAMTSAAALALAATAIAQEAEDNTLMTEQGGITGEQMTDRPQAPLEKAEIATEVEDEFEIADADDDGNLTQEEFVTAMSAPSPIGEGDLDPALAPEGEPAESAAAMPTASEYLIAKFQSISGDDVKVTKKELKKARMQDFSEADTDGDDVLTGEELETYAALKSGKTSY